jgi:hypothetical protein
LNYSQQAKRFQQLQPFQEKSVSVARQQNKHTIVINPT